MTQLIGYVLRSTTSEFVVGRRPTASEIPPFGGLVQAETAPQRRVFGLIYDVQVKDDPFVRQLVAARDPSQDVVSDNRQRRQTPVEVFILAVGETADGVMRYGLPIFAPDALTAVYMATPAEMGQFFGRFTYLDLVLNASTGRADQLLVAAWRNYLAGQPESVQQAFYLRAGKTLAQQLGRDAVRLENILRQLR